MISIDKALLVHKILVNKFGGSKGIRDYRALDSALNRPYQTFDGNDLYPTIEEKAASLIESIIVNHPFIDGNKRTGYVLMNLLLMENNLKLNATQNEKFDFVINIASGNTSLTEIVNWIRKNTR